MRSDLKPTDSESPISADSLIQRGTLRSIQRDATVVAVSDASVLVELWPISGCAGCERQRQAGFGPGHCGIDLLGLSTSPSVRSFIEVPLSNVRMSTGSASDCRIGESVRVELPEPDARWLTLVFMVYGLPTLGLLVGAGLGALVGEPAAIATAFAGLFAGLHIGRRAVHVSHSAQSFKGPLRPDVRIVETVD